MCRMAFHDSVEHSLYSSRVIFSGHYHNGSEMLLVGPLRTYLTFIFSSINSGDLHDIRHAKRAQSENLPCPFILIGKPSADEFRGCSARRVLKNRDSLRDASLHEVRRFERPSATGVNC